MKLPVKLAEAVQKSNFTDLTEAEKIASNYAPFMQEVTEQMTILKTLNKGEIEDVEVAKRIRLDLGKICSKIGEQKTKDKSILLIKSRFVDGLFNTVNGAARLTQEEAKEIEKHFELLEEKKVQELLHTRLAELDKYMDVEGSIVPVLDLGNMQEDVWSAFLESKKVAKQKEDEKAKQAELERIKKLEEEEAERKRQEKENKRIAAENKKLKEQQEKREAQLAKEEKERKEKEAKLEAQRKEKERKEKEALEKKAEADRKKLQDEIDKKNKAEADRVAENNRRILEQKKLKEAELAKGDEDKVKDLIAELEAITTKYEFKSQHYKNLYSSVKTLLSRTLTFITQF